jgi:hypothetical protein
MSLKHLQQPPICCYNIHIKQLQHTSETSETIETYICNIGEVQRLCRSIPVVGVWEPAVSGGARAPLASCISGGREHHRHRHRAWVSRAGGVRNGQSEHHQHWRTRQEGAGSARDGRG